MRGTANRAAFKAYLEGERLFTVVDRARMARCRRQFEKATGLDPAFARAWGWRAYATVRSVLAGWLPEAQMQAAGAWAEEATRLDPDDYATWWDLAFYHLNTGDFRAARRHYERALRLYDRETDLLDRKPGLLAEMGEAYVHMGEAGRGIALLERAMRVPDWYKWNLGWAHFLTGAYDKAIAAYESMRARPGDRGYVPEVALFLAAAYERKAAQARRRRDAAAEAEARRAAERALGRFRRAQPDVTLQDALRHRSRFQDARAAERWRAALAGLGLDGGSAPPARPPRGGGRKRVGRSR